MLVLGSNAAPYSMAGFAKQGRRPATPSERVSELDVLERRAVAVLGEHVLADVEALRIDTPRLSG